MESEAHCDCGHKQVYHNDKNKGKCMAWECPCQLFHQHREHGTDALASRLADALVNGSES